MALPEKRHEDRIDEHTVEDSGRRASRHDGHNFAKDLHPERYPRESLSTLEEGILDDRELRHADDHLGYTGPDLEHRIEEIRSLSRTLLTLGGFLLIFAFVLLLWVGWDVRSGQMFFTTMWAISVTLGLGLVGWGLIERHRIVRLHNPLAHRREQIRRERTV